MTVEAWDTRLVKFHLLSQLVHLLEGTVCVLGVFVGAIVCVLWVTCASNTPASTRDLLLGALVQGILTGISTKGGTGEGELIAKMLRLVNRWFCFDWAFDLNSICFVFVLTMMQFSNAICRANRSFRDLRCRDVMDGNVFNVGG